MSRRNREADAAEVIGGVLEAAFVGTAQRALVALDPTGRVGEGLGDTTVERWQRHAGPGDERARPWPAKGEDCELATLRVPKGRDALEMSLQAVVERCSPGATVLVYGANDEGIRSAAPLLEQRLEHVHTVETKRHCRVWRGRRPADTEVAGLDQWIGTVELQTPLGAAQLRSAPGLFAHGRLDAATSLLLECVSELELAPGTRVLDYGCGAGAIAWGIHTRQARAALTLLDRDALAIHVARQNLPDATHQLGDGLASVGDERFDWIVSNPPLHDGKENAPQLLVDFIQRAPSHLTRAGRLLLVTHRSGPAPRLLSEHFHDCDVLRETRSSRVWLARRARAKRA